MTSEKNSSTTKKIFLIFSFKKIYLLYLNTLVLKVYITMKFRKQTQKSIDKTHQTKQLVYPLLLTNLLHSR